MYTQLNKKTSWVNEQDYILGSGEPGYDTKEHILKIGNGENKWSELSPALSLAINEFYGGEIQKENTEAVFEESVVARVNY